MSVIWLRDAQRKKAYRAEVHSVEASGLVPGGISEFQAMCSKMVIGLPSSFGNPKPPRITYGAVRNVTFAYAYPAYSTWKIELSKTQPMYRMYASHEVAHLLSHRWCELHKEPYEPHGATWAALYVYLTWRHIDKTSGMQLRSDFSSSGVRVAKFADFA